MTTTAEINQAHRDGFITDDERLDLLVLGHLRNGDEELARRLAYLLSIADGAEVIAGASPEQKLEVGVELLRTVEA